MKAKYIKRLILIILGVFIIFINILYSYGKAKALNKVPKNGDMILAIKFR